MLQRLCLASALSLVVVGPAGCGDDAPIFFPFTDAGSSDTGTAEDAAQSDAGSATDAESDAESDAATDGSAGDTSESDTGGTADTGDEDASAGDTGDGPLRPGWRDNLPTPPAFDCPDDPFIPTEVRRLPGARGYHGLAFDDEGYLYGSDGDSIVRADVEGNVSVWLPNVGTVEQFDRLDNGDLIIGYSGGIRRVTPEGSSRRLAPDLRIYGVEVAPDGYVYAAGNDGVWRINPDTGAYDTILPGRNDFLPHTVTFNQDYTQIFVGVVTGFFGGGDDDNWDDDDDWGEDDPNRSARRIACSGLGNGDGCVFQDENDVAVLGECVKYRGEMQCYKFDFGPGGDFTPSDEQLDACEGRSDGQDCDYTVGGVEVSGECYRFEAGAPVECWDFRFNGRNDQPQATPAQVRACVDEVESSPCDYVSIQGDVVEGECLPLGEGGQLQCWDPADVVVTTPERFVACEELGAGDDCEYTDPFAGDVTGTCTEGIFPEDPLECVPEAVEPEPEPEPEPDPSRLDGSEILTWDVDADLNPVGERRVYAQDVGGGYHDALKFDLCGNLYVTDFMTTSLFRIDPEGEVTLLIDWNGDGELGSYGHGIVWGPGHSGWRADAAYFPLPYAGDEVQEIIIGIPGVRWDGTGREVFE